MSASALTSCIVTAALGGDLHLSRPLLQLHRATTLDEFWVGVRGVLTAALPSHSISVYLNYFDMGRDFRALHHQFTPGHPRPWAERRKVSPTPEYLRTHVGRKIFGLNELIPDPTALPDSSYFRNVMVAEGWHSLLCLTYWREAQPSAMIVVRKTPVQGEFSPAEYELLEVLYDHFEVVLRRLQQRHDEQAAQACLAHCLPHYPLGVLVLGPALELLFRNQEALTACLHWNYGAQARRRYDPVKAFHVPPELETACRALARAWAGTDGAARTLSSETVQLEPERAAPWKVSVSLIRPRDCCLAQPCFLVQLAHPAGPAAGAGVGRMPPTGLLELQRLTPREQEVARAAMAGLSNIEIALQLGKTEATVKAQLFSIFQKLGIQRRSQLAAALQ